MRFFNPWKRVKVLEAKLAELEWRVETAEEIAYRKCQVHFDEQTKQLQLMNTELLAKIVTYHSLSAFPIIIKKGDSK